MATVNSRAIRLQELHNPKDPLVLCNVYDGETARIVLQNGGAKALATSSWAVAAVRGIHESKLTPEQLVRAVEDIISVIDANSGDSIIPLSVDMRDGWGDQLESVVESLIQAGAAGCNIEDEYGDTEKLMRLEEAKSRVARVVATATRLGVPNFAVNARTDVLGHNGTVDDAIQRGKAYLEAGATSVFVWGGLGGRGVSRDEIVKLVGAFDGRLNARLKTGPGYLTIPEVKELGVARISLGKELQEIAMAAYKQEVDKLLA